MKVSDNVGRQIGRFLEPRDVPEALALLEQAEMPFIGGTADRLQFALILLALRDLNRFKSELKHAQMDWRDTLATAGLAGDDWPEILRGLGIEVEPRDIR
jgi:hypothetical protein